jgi:calcineurin-like phosphoesterase family protein
MTTWFTADLHLGHVRILDLCKRPFRDIKEMDSVIISNWNARVGPTDVVYVLGDFSFIPKQYFDSLTGIKRLIRGNHDDSNTDYLWDEVHDTLLWKNTFFLSHYPHRVWPGMHKGIRHLFGHVHGETRKLIPGSFDIGVDCTDFRPLSLASLQQKIPIPTLETLNEELAR